MDSLSWEFIPLISKSKDTNLVWKMSMRSQPRQVSSRSQIHPPPSPPPPLEHLGWVQDTLKQSELLLEIVFADLHNTHALSSLDRPI